MAKKKLSIVVPLYNEEENIQHLCKNVHEALMGMPFKQHEYEVLYINDGSSDGSLSRLKAEKATYPYMKIVSFRRNAGQTAAISAGFLYAEGDVVVTMDADLQNNPKDIPLLLAKLDEGYDVVSGWRKNRQDAVLHRKIPSFIANKLISWISGVKLKDYGCTLKAYRTSLVKSIRLYGEMHRFIPIYVYWEGGSITEIPVSHFPRKYGKSKYGIIRTFKVVLDLMTIKFLSDFSQKPIYLFGGGGLILFLGGLIMSLKVLYERLVLDIPGVLLLTNIMLVVLFFVSALLFISLGILAEILMRIYYESQDKTTYKIGSVE